MRLGIGIPLVNRMIDRDFFLSFAAMDKPGYTLLAPTREVSGFPKDIAHVRDSIVLDAMKNELDVLCMMDTDQVYPTDTIRRLLAGLQKFDAVGAVVHRRYPPFNPLILRGKLGSYERVPDEEAYSGKLIEIDATGTGCIAYRMDVFKLMPWPWFELRKDDNGMPVGEDIRFCSKMKAAGFSIGADTAVQVDHLTTFRVDRSTHQLFELMKGQNNG